jgi:hypothetical protein
MLGLRRGFAGQAGTDMPTWLTHTQTTTLNNIYYSTTSIYIVQVRTYGSKEEKKLQVRVLSNSSVNF